MKKQYIQLATTILQIHPISTVCVGSVRGNVGVQYQGGDGGDEGVPVM